MRRLFASIITCGLVVGLACASGTPNSVPPPSAPIQALIDQLGAEGFADREAASASLEKIGLPAMEALRLAARSENQEIRDRAVIILSKIQRAVDSLRLAPKRVKLSYKDMPIGTALNDLRIQTGLNIVLDPNRIANPLRRVTCETQELPIWEALEAFCVSAGLREVFAPELDVPKQQVSRRGYVPPPPVPNADSIPVVLIDGKPDRLPGDRSTAVRVVALPPTFPGHKVTLGTGEVTLCLDVTPAPGIGWQEVMGVKISRVIDSAGRIGGAGTERTQPSNFDLNGGGIMFVRPGVVMRFDPMGNSVPPETLPNPRVLTVPLRVSTATAGSLKRLEGVVIAEVHALNQQLISVTDLKRNTNAAVTAGEVRFTVLEVKEAPGPGGVGTIRVQLEYPSPWAANMRRRGGGGWNPGWPEPPRANTQANRVEAFDAAGKPFPVTNTSYNDMSDDMMTSIQIIQFTFRPNIGLPAKLVVVGPKPVVVQIPFAMENVPLP